MINRNFQTSKETQDKVKLAKQYIESKYQTIIQKEISYKNNWEKIMKMIKKSQLQDKDKKELEKCLIEKQIVKKRLMRQKDSLNNYELYQIIGKGAFGEVRLAKNIVTNQIVAIKRMQKKKLIGKKQVSSVYLEREFLMKNKSRFLVQLKSTFQDKKYLYIAMQYVSGGDLLHLLIEKDIFTEEQTRFYIAELVLAIEQIHQMNFIHRDIKPDNILIDKSGHIKISDFGLSKYLEKNENDTNLTKMASIRKYNEIKQRRTRKFSKVGTPDYISPQILTDQIYDHTVDIWSIGVIMFECLFGYPPFSHEDSKEVCQRVIRWNEFLQFPDDIEASLEAKMLILGMMNSRTERLSLKQIKNHPFFHGFDWQKIGCLTPPYIPSLDSELDTKNFEEFQEQIPWKRNYCQKDGEQQTQQQFYHHKRRSSSLKYRYNFVGFDYQKYENHNDDLLNETAKRIETMERVRYYAPKSPNIKKSKRIHTEQSGLTKDKWSSSKDFLKDKKCFKENILKEAKNVLIKKGSKCRLLKKVSTKPKIY